MKTVLVLIAIFIFSSAYSQELNVGVMVGPGALALDSKMITFGTTVEYKPTKAMLSFNIDPFLISLPDKLIFTAPVYLKFIFGDQIRFCPTFGGFIRSNASYGFKTGLNIEFKINKSLFLFGTGDFYFDNYKDTHPTHFGSMEYIERSRTFWMSIGIKKNILRYPLAKSKIPASGGSNTD